MISIVVPVYNVENYLEKCILSIVGQTYKNIEIILVDDGSTDKSPELCDYMKSLYNNIVVIHQSNKGLASARNTGLSHSNGKYIMFVDSDDTIAPNTCQVLKDMINGGNYDLAITGVRKVSEDYDVIVPSYNKNMTVSLTKDDLWNELFGNLNNSVCNKLYKKSILSGLLFDKNLVKGEDFIFNLKYLLRIENGCINEVLLYNYLTRENSITRSKFNISAFKEIEAKDIARDIVYKHYPKLSSKADLFSFRARMNVLRLIYQTDKVKYYQKEINELKKYVAINYYNTKKYLRYKERIEVFLFNYCNSVYRFIVKRFID